MFLTPPSSSSPLVSNRFRVRLVRASTLFKRSKRIHTLDAYLFSVFVRRIRAIEINNPCLSKKKPQRSPPRRSNVSSRTTQEVSPGVACHTFERARHKTDDFSRSYESRSRTVKENADKFGSVRNWRHHCIALRENGTRPIVTLYRARPF